jgi:hypothetical protein
MGKGWTLVPVKRADEPIEVHVLPVDDDDTHDVTSGACCHCTPRVEPTGKAVLVVHNAHDGRELIERHGIN